MSTEQNQSFDQWAILEVLGHQKYAGKVSSQSIAGASMLLLEVPEVKNEEVTLPAFQKFFNTSSIYCVTPVSEDYAMRMAEQLSKHPIEGYDHTMVVKQLAKKATEQMTLSEIKNMISQGRLESPNNELEF